MSTAAEIQDGKSILKFKHLIVRRKIPEKTNTPNMDSSNISRVRNVVKTRFRVEYDLYVFQSSTTKSPSRVSRIEQKTIPEKDTTKSDLVNEIPTKTKYEMGLGLVSVNLSLLSFIVDGQRERKSYWVF